ncbi:NADH dehydrogenase [ubiquinone] 1 beta subcomplex subunit 11, mitochondrial [Nasonia vitripennis]|uniref:NADH dehydrogenase [ubiquinone] 1 beta subcomplex subunit 11, mitochondrial n=1 Tax=Nasonia vitripennis TaxID=7425 RepID=A0A7M7HF70_NASVI|nr:NADH dehydrogenase [ubiquinone] 1 beta subcomplex subunit 11, mitochondrial [Nasonia vitripennis]
MAGIMCLRNAQRLVGRLSPAVVSRTRQPLNLCRAVGTSGTQKSETTTVDQTKTATTTATECEIKPKKYWVSYGFSEESEYLDRHFMHMFTFISISVVFGIGGYILIYLPDFRMRDWALREAYLELRRREQSGLPLIDPNVIDPAKVILPSDEELGDREIII